MAHHAVMRELEFVLSFHHGFFSKWLRKKARKQIKGIKRSALHTKIERSPVWNMWLLPTSLVLCMTDHKRCYNGKAFQVILGCHAFKNVSSVSSIPSKLWAKISQESIDSTIPMAGSKKRITLPTSANPFLRQKLWIWSLRYSPLCFWRTTCRCTCFW